jgi:hypothetical protein
LLEVIWKLYPARRAVLMPYRGWLGSAFLMLAIVMASASIGCFRRRIWDWRLGVVIFPINGLSDAGQILIGHFLEGVVSALLSPALSFFTCREPTCAGYLPKAQTIGT